MKAYIVLYKCKNGKNVQVVVLRDGYESGTLEEQVADSDSNFAEMLTCDKFIESTIIHISG